MPNSTSMEIDGPLGVAKLIVLVIRLTATVGFVVAPASLGFVVIGIAEQLIVGLLCGNNQQSTRIAASFGKFEVAHAAA